MKKYDRYVKLDSTLVCTPNRPPLTSKNYTYPVPLKNGVLFTDNIQDVGFAAKDYRFGPDKHCGVDICRPADTVVYAVADGLIKIDTTWDARSNDYFHIGVIIEHSDRCGQTFYGYYLHIRSCLYKEQVRVNAGDTIGFIADPYDRGDGHPYTIKGKPAKTSQKHVPHLHFGVNKKYITGSWGIAPEGKKPSDLGFFDPEPFLGFYRDCRR